MKISMVTDNPAEAAKIREILGQLNEPCDEFTLFTVSKSAAIKVETALMEQGVEVNEAANWPAAFRKMTKE